MGAQRASWQAALQAETSKYGNKEYVQSLLDLVKAFETVKHDLVIAAAQHHGDNPWVLPCPCRHTEPQDSWKSTALTQGALWRWMG